MSSSDHRRVQTRFHGRALIAEDIRTNQILMKSLLNKLGLEVIIAGDGQEAVQKASSGVFEVILMDIQMPVMDGCQATRTLREQGTTVPIIALTGHTDEADKSKCFEAGCNDYLSKPIDPRCLAEKLAKYLPSDGVLPDPAPSCQIDAGPVIDWDALVSRGFDEALISSVMPICLDDNRKRLQELTLALQANSVEDVRLVAHAMKGSFAMIGVVNLAQIACRLEEKAKQRDLSMTEPLLAGLEKGFHELQVLVSRSDWTKVVKGQAKPVGAAPGN